MLKQAERLNLGCGSTRPTGWFNGDASLNSLAQKLPFFGSVWRNWSGRVRYEETAHYIDLRKPWPFADNSVRIVYGSHIFEHLSISSRDHFLRESRRVLVAKGIIRLVVPDLYCLAQKYVQNVKTGDATAASGEFLYWMNMHIENIYPSTIPRIHRWLCAAQGYPHTHKYMYDRWSLSALLEANGFNDVAETSYGISPNISEITDVEHTAEGCPSIYIEARK